MNRNMIMAFVLATFLCSCTGLPKGNAPGQARHAAAAVSSLNNQIAAFNANRHRGSGVLPIDQRVARVNLGRTTGLLTCFDRKGNHFLVLKREADGRFKGALEVEFHEPAEGDAWSEGVIRVEFNLEKELF